MNCEHNKQRNGILEGKDLISDIDFLLVIEFMNIFVVKPIKDTNLNSVNAE